jgi:eukaryotic-like serine/threonine-protein kinase
MNTRILNPLPPPIPDHVLLRRIGAGSYGEVWLAKNVLGAYRAVKIVHRATFPSERPYEREFEGIRNYEPISRTHAGLVNVLHVGRDALAECFFYVMEVADDMTGKPVSNPDTYLPRTLHAELKKRGRFDAAESAEIIAQLAAALAHLHRHGLIHRDIKPANIIFVNGAPKFADIGLVTGLGGKATLVGTEGYLAPEGPGSAAADIFSLGKVKISAAALPGPSGAR